MSRRWPTSLWSTGWRRSPSRPPHRRPRPRPAASRPRDGGGAGRVRPGRARRPGRRSPAARLGVRRNPRERTVARLLGARHLAQAVLTTLVADQRARLVGGGVDALHSSSMVAWALADRRRARQAWGEAVSAALFAGGGAGPAAAAAGARRVQARRDRGAAAGRATAPAGDMGVSGDAASPTHARLTAPDPERERRQRAAIRQRVDRRHHRARQRPGDRPSWCGSCRRPWPGAGWPPSRGRGCARSPPTPPWATSTSSARRPSATPAWRCPTATASEVT